MKYKVLLVGFVMFLWVTGIVFSTFSSPPQIAPVAKPKVKVWTKNDSRELAKEYAWAGFGWRGREWGCIKELWWRESRWDFRADNPKSTAYGLSQLLGEKSTSPQVQVLKGYRYIEQRFTTPCKALGFHNRHGYY